jgi:putative transposase
LRVGDPGKGPWPAPVVDRLEALAAKYAEAWPAWGYRKIAAMMRADGHEVSNSSVQRALRRRGLLLPQGFRADRKSWAALRRKVFREPPTERNRVWQTDFSEFETACGGIWRISAVIDYVTKYCLSITVTPTSRGADAVRCVQLAVEEAQFVLGLHDLRADRGLMDVLDAEDTVIGQAPAPIAVVSDNGPCYRGATFKMLFIDDDPLLRHVRTRINSPQTNGVIERFFGSLKYEHLFRGYIGDGDALDMEAHRFRIIYNTIRPHQALGYRTPKQAYQHPPTHENLPKS